MSGTGWKDADTGRCDVMAEPAAMRVAGDMAK
jgi:hypothetical protein